MLLFFFFHIHSGYSLLHVVNVVRREDKDVGSRYLVELELVGPQGQKVLVSRYVYTLESSNEVFLCSPKAFNWNPSATVHVIVAGETNQIYQYLSFNCTAFKSCWTYNNYKMTNLIFRAIHVFRLQMLNSPKWIHLKTKYMVKVIKIHQD